jgi:hypothetical protein
VKIQQSPFVWLGAGLVLLAAALGVSWWTAARPAPLTSDRATPKQPSSAAALGHAAPLETASPSATPVPTKEGLVRRKAELRAAWDAALRLPPSEQKTETLSRLCYQWAESDPRGAIDLAFDSQLDGAAVGLIENLAQQWAAVDIESAREWVVSQEAGPARAELVARIGYVWAKTDPAAAADFVVREMPPGGQQTEAAISVLYQWGLRDPEAARAWASAFPPGPLRDRALAEVSAGSPTPGGND